MKIFRNTVLAIGILAIVVAFFLFGLDTFKIKYFDYKMSPDILEEDLFRLAGIEKGKTSIFMKSTSQIEKELSKHPYIATVSCLKVYPDTLKLDLKVKEEFVSLKQGNLNIVVDSGGQVMKVTERKTSGVVLEGVTVLYYKVGEPLKTEQAERFESVLDLVDLLKQADLDKSARINSDSSGCTLYLGELRVKFGNLNHLEDQFNRFVAVYADLVKRKSMNGEIDVSGKGLPTYRPFGN